MKEITIDFDNYSSSNLILFNYILLQLIIEKKYDYIKTIVDKEVSFPNIVDKLEALESMGYIKIIDSNKSDIDKILESITIRRKGDDLFSTRSIEFDEFFFAFPHKTPGGRVLRTKEKEFGGKLTNDYVEARKKYLSRVKSKDMHDQIVKIRSTKTKSAPSSTLEYENNIITYINQRKWERDSVFLSKSPSFNFTEKL